MFLFMVWMFFVVFLEDLNGFSLNYFNKNLYILCDYFIVNEFVLLVILILGGIFILFMSLVVNYVRKIYNYFCFIIFFSYVVSMF